MARSARTNDQRGWVFVNAASELEVDVIGDGVKLASQVPYGATIHLPLYDSEGYDVLAAVPSSAGGSAIVESVGPSSRSESMSLVLGLSSEGEFTLSAWENDVTPLERDGGRLFIRHVADSAALSLEIDGIALNAGQPLTNRKSLGGEVPPSDSYLLSAFGADAVPALVDVPIQVRTGMLTTAYIVGGPGAYEVLSYEFTISTDVEIADCYGFAPTVRIARGDLPTEGDDVILGTKGDDVIAGLAGDDVICALGGHDTVWGQDGADVIDGGPGDDKLRGGNGDDFVDGGEGVDDIAGGRDNDTVLGGPGPDVAVRGNTGDDTVDGGADSDLLVAGNGGEDSVYGGPGDETLISGGPRPDILYGGPGNDLIKGLGGADTILGGGGNDDLRGGKQADFVDGGEGLDVCAGGNEDGEDRDVSAGCESVTGFGGAL